jgi:transposase
MIPPEVRARIRRLFYAEHWRVGTIACELGVHPDTVHRAIESERFQHATDEIHASRLDPYQDFIAEVLERHPRLRATRLYEMIRGRGYPGSVYQVRRYVRTVRPAAQKEAYLKLRTLPAEQGQVDWGNFGKIRVGHAWRKLSCFVLVLSWSRALFAPLRARSDAGELPARPRRGLPHAGRGPEGPAARLCGRPHNRA